MDGEEERDLTFGRQQRVGVVAGAEQQELLVLICVGGAPSLAWAVANASHMDPGREAVWRLGGCGAAAVAVLEAGPSTTVTSNYRHGSSPMVSSPSLSRLARDPGWQARSRPLAIGTQSWQIGRASCRERVCLYV